MLGPGDPAPWFHQRSTSNPRYAFDTVAGRYIALCFFASAGDPRGRSALEAVLAHRDRFDDSRISFFGVSVDPLDEAQRAACARSCRASASSGISTAASAASTGPCRRRATAPRDKPVSVRQFWIILDPTLRVMAVFPFVGRVRPPTAPTPRCSTSWIACRRPIASPASRCRPRFSVLPDVFEPEFCRRPRAALRDGRRRGVWLHARGQRQDGADARSWP